MVTIYLMHFTSSSLYLIFEVNFIIFVICSNDYFKYLIEKQKQDNLKISKKILRDF